MNSNTILQKVSDIFNEVDLDKINNQNIEDRKKYINDIIKSIQAIYIDYQFGQIPLDLYQLHISLLYLINDVKGILKLTDFLHSVFENKKLINNKNLTEDYILNMFYINIYHLLSLFLLNKDTEFLKESDNFFENIVTFNLVIKKYHSLLNGFINSNFIFIQIIKKILVDKDKISNINLLDDIMSSLYPKYLKDKIDDRFIYLLFQTIIIKLYKGNLKDLLKDYIEIKTKYINNDLISKNIKELEKFILGTFLFDEIDNIDVFNKE